MKDKTGRRYGAVAASRLRFGLECYGLVMTVENIKEAVQQLAPRELSRFRAWFEAFDAEQFDDAIERDIRDGKLDAYADVALTGYRAGYSRDDKSTG